MAFRRHSGLVALLLLCALLSGRPAYAENGAAERIDGEFFTLTYLGERWQREEKPSSADAAYELRHRDGGAHAVLLVGPPGPDLDQLKLHAMSAARNTLEHFRLTFEADHRLGRVRVAVLRFEGVADGVALNYYNYYWAGPEGTLQLLTLSPSREYPVMRRDMQALLDGLRISPSRGNSGAAAGVPVQ